MMKFVLSTDSDCWKGYIFIVYWRKDPIIIPFCMCCYEMSLIFANTNICDIHKVQITLTKVT